MDTLTISRSGLKQHIIHSLESIPPEGLKEVADFLEYIHYCFRGKQHSTKHYRPKALGGLWKDLEISDEDIADIRKEMWGNLGDKVL